MRTVIVFFILTLLPFMVWGQTIDEDTIASTHSLNEIVVEAQMQRTSAKSSTYLPGKNQKNAAQNAVSLLGLMSIPEIDIDPVSNVVKTAAGEDVSIFIDFVPATKEDLQGMKTTDVKKVEYYHYPSDPRFQNTRYAINFIMQKYEWGGYTKINADKSFGVNRTEAYLYSKMTYKAMTFDIYAREYYMTNRHNGIFTTERFRFTDLFGNGPMSVERTTVTDASKFRNNINDVSFRALYNTGKTQLSNVIGVNYSNVPINEQFNSLRYSSDLFEGSNSRANTWGNNMTFTYTGDYFFVLPRNLSLSIYGMFRYGNNKSNSDYSIYDGLEIVNNATEKSYNGTFAPTLAWNINGHNSLSFFGSGNWLKDNIDYFGDSQSRQKYVVSNYRLGTHYDIYYDKWQAGMDFGWNWERNNISGNRLNNSYPNASVYASFNPAERMQLSLAYNINEDLPSAMEKSPNRLQQDELLWYQGNPELKNTLNQNANLQYLWLISNKWQIAAGGIYAWLNNRRVSYYSPFGPDGTMLRQYINNGSHRNGAIMISATARFLNGNLVAKASPQIWFKKTTGEYALTRNEFTCSLQLSYYFKNFYITGFYKTPNYNLEEQSGMEVYDPSQYNIEIGWGNGKWNLSATANNFLRSNWESSRQTLIGEYYSMHKYVYSPERHMRFSVSATYTFGYGKKVVRSNEVSGSGSAESAILK